MVHIDENFVARPLRSNLDFKELFQEALSARAGLSSIATADRSTEWTPSLLAEAIAVADPKGRGVDVRTVQNWFQDNDRGISSENIICLARVFGAGDPDAILCWRTELRAANKRLASQRRERRENPQNAPATEHSTGRKNERGSFAALSESIFTSSNGLSIATLVWAGFFTLCLASFISKNHDITYPVGPDLDKQIGFVWSLSWPIECLLLYPALFLLIGNLVAFWKRESYASLPSGVAQQTWNDTICRLRLPFWVAACVSFVLIFAVQWSGVYLVGLTQAEPPDLVDWILVAQVRPDVVSISEALFVSLLAFAYSGMIYWFYFIGLLLLFAITEDFSRRASSTELNVEHSFFERAGDKLQRGIFNATVIGVSVATAIQLNAIYLKSDGRTSLSWLAGDFVAGLNSNAESWALLEQSSISSLTSSLLLLLHLALFVVCTTKVRSALQTHYRQNVPSEQTKSMVSTACEPATRDPLLKQICILGLLCLNFSLLGRFVGFTILLLASLLLAITSIFWSEKGSRLRPTVEK